MRGSHRATSTAHEHRYAAPQTSRMVARYALLALG